VAALRKEGNSAGRASPARGNKRNPLAGCFFWANASAVILLAMLDSYRLQFLMKGGRMRVGISLDPGWFPIAVQALVVLAETDGACPSSSMAQDLKTHAVFVRRVLAQLVRGNIVRAREGRDGGYLLARPAEHITLAEVYRAVATPDTAEYPPCTGGVSTRVEAVLDSIGAEAEDYLLELLSRYTLASVLERADRHKKESVDPFS
jgi:Rrf2 family transcriptional repressor of oqxAB